MALGISGCSSKLTGHLAPCPFRVVWGQAASFLSLSFPLCNTRGLTYPTDFSKPPSGYQERVWTDAKESQNGAKRFGAARRELDKALLTGRGSLRNRELLGQSPRGESKQSGIPLPRPHPSLCPESSCAPRRAERARVARPPGPDADWTAARAAAGQARS